MVRRALKNIALTNPAITTLAIIHDINVVFLKHVNDALTHRNCIDRAIVDLDLKGAVIGLRRRCFKQLVMYAALAGCPAPRLWRVQHPEGRADHRHTNARR